jgi:hypothetical protein
MNLDWVESFPFLSERSIMKRICLLILLVSGLSLCTCGTKKSGSGEEAQAPAAAGSSEASQQLMSLFPAKDEVPGWAMLQKPRSYKSDNLWEFIDGAADAYLSYGFQEVASADYAQASMGHQAVIDIYWMKDPLDAFGIYAQERNPEYQFLKIGNEGYTGGSSLNFWSGPYYVKITTFEDKEELRQEMSKLAAAIAGKVSAPGAEPIEASYFPKENQVPHTIAYLSKDVLAQSYFTCGFQAKYKAAGKEYKMVLVTLGTSAAAQDGLARYREYISSGGGKVAKDLRAPGEGGFSGMDGFYGNLAAIRAGSNIAVILGAPSEGAGIKMIAELLGNIK